MKKILIICPYPTGRAPSQRFRFEQFLGLLENKGFNVAIKPFFTQKSYSAFHQSEKILPKIRAFIRSYIGRFQLLLHVNSFDFIFIHREAAPVGPPLIEFAITKLFRKKVIYDFDDAIWLTDDITEPLLAHYLRWRSKVQSICKWSDKVSCGNEYLHAYAVQFNKNCFVIPTTIDTSNLHVPTNQEHDTTSVGWTGSHSTLKYLEALVPVLQSLEKKYPQVEFIIIADRNPRLPVERARFIPWRKDTEISDLARIDIGIMPLPDDPWANGKCGFKALQYLAMGIPAVVSPVGVNKQIVEPGVQGYWSSSLEEWFDKIEQLILNHEQRKQMGRQGRLKVLAQYSTESQADKFLSLFQ